MQAGVPASLRQALERMERGEGESPQSSSTGAGAGARAQMQMQMLSDEVLAQRVKQLKNENPSLKLDLVLEQRIYLRLVAVRKEIKRIEDSLSIMGSDEDEMERLTLPYRSFQKMEKTLQKRFELEQGKVDEQLRKLIPHKKCQELAKIGSGKITDYDEWLEEVDSEIYALMRRHNNPKLDRFK